MSSAVGSAQQQVLAGLPPSPGRGSAVGGAEFWFLRRQIHLLAGGAHVVTLGELVLTLARGRGQLRLSQFAGADRTSADSSGLDYSVWRRDPSHQVVPGRTLWDVKAKRDRPSKRPEYLAVGELLLSENDGQGQLRLWLFGDFTVERPSPT